jgi:predicted AAA+ superfamily ATPase
MSNFHTQGAVPLDSPAYVEREFERNVIQNVFNARWVLVLGPRQHGKTTGLIRVNNYLEHSGFLSAFVDFQGLVALQVL